MAAHIADDCELEEHSPHQKMKLSEAKVKKALIENIKLTDDCRGEQVIRKNVEQRNKELEAELAESYAILRMIMILNVFTISAKVPVTVKTSIKTFHVFKDSYNNMNIIFITKEDMVYGLGQNMNGLLGFGHNNSAEQITEIEELCHQKITDFFIGETFVLAKNGENQLFGWGLNDWGQLGRGFTSGASLLARLTLTNKKEYLKPQLIELAENLIIETVCCGAEHTVLLMSDRNLYGWGCNSSGQLGLHKMKIINKPTKLIISETNDLRFKFIYCRDWSSYAITANDVLFSWGYNWYGKLGQPSGNMYCIPRVVDLFSVERICSLKDSTYFITNENKLFVTGQWKNVSPVLGHGHLTINNLYDHGICSDTGNTFYSLNDGNLVKIEEKYESISELFAKRFGITPQTFHMTFENQTEGHSQRQTVEQIGQELEKAKALIERLTKDLNLEKENRIALEQQNQELQHRLNINTESDDVKIEK